MARSSAPPDRPRRLVAAEAWAVAVGLALSLVLLALLVLVIPAGDAQAQTAPPPPPAASAARAASEPIVFAVAGSVYGAPVWIALANGFFDAEGVAVTVRPCAVGRVCVRMLLDGQAQLATAGETPIAIAGFARRDFGILATIATSGTEQRIIARADRGVQQIGDLKGRRISVVTGTSAHFYLEMALIFNGLSRSDVTLVPADPAEPHALLRGGEVDAAALFEPHLSTALRTPGIRAVALPTLDFHRMTFNLVAAAGARDDDLRRVLRGLQRAAAFAIAQPRRAQEQVAQAIGAAPADVEALWRHFRFDVELDQTLIHALEGHARWAQREGLAPGGPLPNTLRWIRSAPLRAVDARAVRMAE